MTCVINKTASAGTSCQVFDALHGAKDIGNVWRVGVIALIIFGVSSFDGSMVSIKHV